MSLTPMTVTPEATKALARAAGQLLFVGFDGKRLPDELGRRIGASEVGGIILFKPNVGSPSEVATLVRSARGATASDGPPCLVAVDQEGGLVQRLRAPLTEWPDMFSVGAAADQARSERVGRALGEELAALGIGWNFAPVLDVHSNPQNPVIGSRAFGSTPETVAAHALAFWRGLRGAGVLGCGKHFPGHGDTHADSHHELPVVPHALERLRAVELAPFAAAARAGVEALMTAHVVYPALDPDRPATLSKAVVTELLRGQLGFAGVVVTDDLGMRAVADRYPIEELVVDAIGAGADVLLIREPEEKQRRAHEALVRAGERDAELRRRIEESAARVAALKALSRVAMPAPTAMLPSLLGTPAHRALADSFPRVSANAPSSSPVAQY